MFTNFATVLVLMIISISHGVSASAPIIEIKPIKSIPQIEALEPLKTKKLDKLPQAVIKPSKRTQNGSNTYYAGQCVWAIKQWRPEIPNTWHDATDWWANANADGWPTGLVPIVGAVGWIPGHVVLITAVHGDGTVSYKDMNGRYIPFEIGHGRKPASYYKYIY